MAQLLIRKLDEDIKRRLKGRAERNGRSLEGEVRAILSEVVSSEGQQSVGLGTELAGIFGELEFDPEIAELRGFPVRPASFEP